LAPAQPDFQTQKAWKACHDQLCSVCGPEDHALILDRVLVLSVFILRIVVCCAVLGAVLLMCETA
jgi:hypothetical protein